MVRSKLFLSKEDLSRGGLLWLLFSWFSKGLALYFLLVAFTLSEPRPAFGYGIGTDSPGFPGFSLTGCGFQGYALVPVHQLITLEAADVWTEIPDEIRNHLLSLDQTNASCGAAGYNPEAGYNPGDGIIKGSKEEDEGFNPLADPAGNCLGPSPFGGEWGENCSDRWDVPICGPGQEGCTWPNGFLEHFWNPDGPLTGGYDCGQLAGGYNEGLHDVPFAFPDNGTHFDSSYRLAQFYWDHLVIPLYLLGTNSFKAQAYYWLGRIAHLLEDATVPAHVHDDAHGFRSQCDSYEDSFDNGTNDIFQYQGTNYASRGPYSVEKLPNLENFDWTQVHTDSNPPPLFKLFWCNRTPGENAIEQ